MTLDVPSREPRKRPAPAAKRALKKSEATRARILDAAAFVFRRKGYALTRLSDIAKKAKTRTSSIYYYFDSREAIVAEVLKIANEKTASYVAAAIAAIPEGASSRERITAAIRGHFNVVLSNDDYTSAHMRIFDQIPEKLREHFLRVLDQNAEVWRSLFERARASGEIDSDIDLPVLRLLLLGMMNWSIEWYKTGRMSVDQIAAQAARILFDGIATKSVGQPRLPPSAPEAAATAATGAGPAGRSRRKAKPAV